MSLVSYKSADACPENTENTGAELGLVLGAHRVVRQVGAVTDRSLGAVGIQPRRKQELQKAPGRDDTLN